MLEGYNNCYHETITRLGEEHYNFINPHITKELRNNGTGLFNAGVELAIKTWQRLEVLGAMIFLEMSIPVEFINMTKKARDRLFPDMNPKARFYEDFHIKHDIDRHTA